MSWPRLEKRFYSIIIIKNYDFLKVYMDENLLRRIISGDKLNDIEIDETRFNNHTESVITSIGGYEIRTAITRNPDEYKTEIYRMRYRFDESEEPLFTKKSRSLGKAANIHILLENYITSF